MDPPEDVERPPARRVSYQSISAGRASIDVANSGSYGAGGTRKQIRRGHSEGEVLRPTSGRQNRLSAAAEFSWGERDSWNLAHPEAVNADSPYGKILSDLHALHKEHDADRRKRARLGSLHERRLSTSGYIEGQGSSSRSQQRPYRSTSDSKAVASRTSISDVIDLTSPERSLPMRSSPRTSTTGDRRSREIVLPRWQADTEVLKCPICGTGFNFWYRKHHCRKCGRVVCANCSPHRITIPRQFIVRPPEAVRNSQIPVSGVQVIDLTDHSATMNTTSSGRGSRVVEGLIDPALGGGEEVRICNPCVPDPNFDPPPQQAPESVIHAPHGSSSSDDLSSSLEHPHSPIATARRELERPYMRSHSSRQSHESPFSPHASDRSRPQRFQGSRDEEALIRELRHRGGRPASTASFVSGSEQRVPSPRFNVFVPEPQDPRRHSIYTPSVRAHRREPSNPNAGAAVMSSRYPNPSSSAPTSNYIPNVPPSSRHRQHASTSSSRSAVRSMLDIDTPPSRPRPRLREEDICPICHSALPPKGPDGSETAREQHIIDCLSSHYSPSSPSRVEQHPASSAATHAVMPAQASGDNNNRDSQLQRPRVNHMLRYAATEKDCVGDNGEAQECVICFEEFAVGVDMARLECLCKFHKVCIRQWWDTKGDGSCPVHIELKG